LRWLFVICFVFSFSNVGYTDETINIAENIKSALVYDYEFSKKFAIAGERILRIYFENNTDFDVEALEFEIQLIDAFGDEISEWNSFVDPGFSLKKGEKANLALTLTQRNILGVDVGNLLDKAKEIELRFKRVLIGDGTIIEKHDFYPELKNIFGKLRVAPTLLNNYKNDEMENSFILTNQNRDSIAYDIAQAEFEPDPGASIFETMMKEMEALMGTSYIEPQSFKDFDNVFGRECLIVLLEITNVSNEPMEKNFASSHRPYLLVQDQDYNQYTSYGVVYELKGMEGIASGRAPILPNSTAKIVFIFDKRQEQIDYLRLYFDGEVYPEKLKLVNN